MNKKEVILFVNLTKQCNLNCPRCYLTEENRKNKNQLSLDTFRKLIEHPFFIDAYDCTVIWEGGEPTLLGKDKIYEFINLTREVLPRARQTMVTNFLNMPDWLIEMTINEFEGRIETTYAMGNKFTLDGSQERYKERFERSLIKARLAGIEAVVNIELNKETYEMGTDSLASIIKKTQNKFWEFDFSVDFSEHNKNPIYNNYRYPLLNGTITHKQFSEFILELFTKHKIILDEIGVKSSVVEHIKYHFDTTMAFNVKRESEFITINPDGTITTNPLFSDMPMTYLGNLNTQTTDSILNNKAIELRAKYEVVRTRPCLTCEFYMYCGGGASHVKLMDGSGDCAGSLSLWKYFSKKELK